MANKSTTGGSKYAMMYPEIISRLQPDIILACDEMEKQGITSPSPEVLRQMAGWVYTNACKRYPDLAALGREYEKNHPVRTEEMLSINGVRIQQDGFLGGLIAFLLFAEFFGRRRLRRRIRRGIRRNL